MTTLSPTINSLRLASSPSVGKARSIVSLLRASILASLLSFQSLLAQIALY